MDPVQNSYSSVIQKMYNGEMPQSASIFFSDANMTTIHSQITYEVSQYFNTQNVISRQDDRELFLIMKQVFSQTQQHKDQSNKQYISYLNREVVLKSVRIIIPNILQYLGYVKEMQNNYNTFEMTSDQSVNRDILEYSKSSN